MSARDMDSGTHNSAKPYSAQPRLEADAELRLALPRQITMARVGHEDRPEVITTKVTKPGLAGLSRFRTRIPKPSAICRKGSISLLIRVSVPTPAWQEDKLSGGYENQVDGNKVAFAVGR